MFIFSYLRLVQLLFLISQNDEQVNIHIDNLYNNFIE